MAFRSKLARYNTVCCEQVMPVPVIPICAISCCLPTPFYEVQASQQPQQQQQQQQQVLEPQQSESQSQ